MFSIIIDLITGNPDIKSDIRLNCVLLILIFCSPTLFSQEDNPIDDKSISSGIIYRNPRVYNVDYTFELCPEKDSIDLSKDLKLWIPVPREWDSQKAVKIISIDPEPHSTYTDPEHGNRILFWDFEKEPKKDMYVVKIRYRAEVFEVYSNVDPGKTEPYDTKSNESTAHHGDGCYYCIAVSPGSGIHCDCFKIPSGSGIIPQKERYD